LKICQESKFFEKNVKYFTRDAMEPIYVKNNAGLLVQMFATGIHRVPILDEEGNLLMTLSQSSLIRQLANNLHQGKLKQFGQKNLKDYTLGQEKPVSISKDATVNDAINSIVENNVSALPVVDKDGVLVANFSASDLKGMVTEQWPNFTQNVEEFLKSHSKGSLTPVYCSEDINLLDVTNVLAYGGHEKARIHRVWVCDKDKKPIGAVSMTDIMKIVLNYE
jgi:5'-AMP-activated protein kinase, regulatory gamma subunit